MITLEGNARAGVLSLLLLGFCLALPIATRAQDQAAEGRPEMRLPPRRLTVTGEGKVQIRPDKADITIGVVTDNKSSQAAARANAEASQAVQDAVKKVGIAEKDIQTVNYSIQPVMGDPRQAKQTITGYRVYNQVRVTVRNVDRVGDIIDAATNAGSNTIEGISFGLQNDQAVMDQAMAQAVADARRKADVLAKAAGVDIVGIYEINEGSGARPVPMFRSMAAEGFAGGTPVQPGELTSTANVTVVYEISAKHKVARVAPLRRQAGTKTGIKTARAVL